jgi:serine/threonine-protein kinase
MNPPVGKHSPGYPGNIFPVGAIFAERYRMLGVIGKGGMGTVYLAEHTELARKVAIKVLRPEWSADPPSAKRFRVEARTVSALGHPNIVQVFDAGALADGRLFLVMEHLDGRDLAREFASSRTFDVRRACALLRQVALALGTAHRAGVVHRDVKPSNVMVVRHAHGEVAKVLDFGIAANAALTDAAERLTDPGSLIGTPAYMAPEQAADQPPTPAFDVYAVGVMLYELLTGVLPFTGATAFEVLSLKLNRPAAPVDRRRPGLPPLLIKLVADCLATDPAARPTDGDALAARFDEVLAAMQSDSASGSRPAVRRVAPRQRRGAARWVSAGLVAAIVFAVAHVIALLSPDTAIAERNLEVADATPDLQPLAEPEPPHVEQQPALQPAAPQPAPQPAPSAAAATLTPAKAPPPTLAKVAAVKSRAKPAPQTGDAYLTPRCQRIRTSAEEARRTQLWSALRDNSRQHECWASAAEARKLQTKAFMELGDFSSCIATGENLRDPEVQQWLKVCQKRAGG